MKQLALLASATYADASLLSSVLLQGASTCEQLVDAKYFRTAAGLCGFVAILRGECGLALYIVFRGVQGQGASLGMIGLSELVGSFFDEWKSIFLKLASEHARVTLVGHSLGAAVASRVYGTLHELFARWTFCVYTFGSSPFATLKELRALESGCTSLHAWVSVANEGQGFRDMLVYRNDVTDSHGNRLYSWNSCRDEYGEPAPAVWFDSASYAAREQNSQGTPAARIYVVDSSCHVSASTHAFLTQDSAGLYLPAAGGCTTDLLHRQLVNWAAHCAFTCAPGVMVVL
jgi:pimeloyl-ACP methyl ester carboxylesterase